MNSRFLIFVLPILVLAGCDQSFNPKGPFDNTLAVYCVLSTDNDTTIVRVFRTYDPPGFDPYAWTTDPSVTDAAVSLFKEDTAYSVRDTLLARTDTSRYQSPIMAFVAQPFPVEFGKPYSLSINSPTAGSLSANVTVPTKASMAIVNPNVLDYPGGYVGNASPVLVRIQLTISPFTRGYLLRAFFEYDLFSGSQWTAHRQEVPMKFSSNEEGSISPIYPSLKRRETSETSGGMENSFSNSFVIDAFVVTASRLRSQYGTANIRINRAIFVLNQVERNFYNYYNIANGFRDKNSIRLDEPGYTNIHGGEGVFGAFTVEGISHDLPTGVY